MCTMIFFDALHNTNKQAQTCQCFLELSCNLFLLLFDYNDSTNDCYLFLYKYCVVLKFVEKIFVKISLTIEYCILLFNVYNLIYSQIISR